jgi:hypothetical protein
MHEDRFKEENKWYRISLWWKFLGNPSRPRPRRNLYENVKDVLGMWSVAV